MNSHLIIQRKRNDEGITVKVKNSSPHRLSTVGRLSVDSWPTVGRQLADNRPIVGRQSTDSRPTIGRQFAESFFHSGNHLSADRRPTVGKLSVDCRSRFIRYK